jgi:hypothetical protein
MLEGIGDAIEAMVRLVFLLMALVVFLLTVVVIGWSSLAWQSWLLIGVALVGLALFVERSLG